jgi:hypothetical protein
MARNFDFYYEFKVFILLTLIYIVNYRYMLLFGLRHRFAASALLGSQLIIPLRAWMFSLVFVACCVHSGLYDELMTRLDESYRMCARVCECV